MVFNTSRIDAEVLMATLTVTSRGRVTFRRGMLKHLGIEPGGKVRLDLLRGGRVLLQAARPAGSIGSFIGLLAGRSAKVATLEELDEAAAFGWARRE